MFQMGYSFAVSNHLRHENGRHLLTNVWAFV